MNTSTPVSYYSVLIGYVKPKLATEWHPTSPTGPFSVLSRGAFATKAEAHAWAKAHIPGRAYKVKGYA